MALMTDADVKCPDMMSGVELLLYMIDTYVCITSWLASYWFNRLYM